MRMDYDAPKPDIRIFYNDKAKCGYVIANVTNGIEEEGLPYEIEESDELDPVELAYRGAEVSHLGVGMGITDKEVVLHYIKLKEDQPLSRIPSYSSEEILRAMGSNAARLVKRMPFKSLTGETDLL